MLTYPLPLTKLPVAKIMFQADNHFAVPGQSGLEILAK